MRARIRRDLSGADQGGCRHGQVYHGVGERLGLLAAEYESVAAAFAAKGITCADVGLLEGDVVWMQQIVDRSDVESSYEDSAYETL